MRKIHLAPYLSLGVALWLLGLAILWFRLGASPGIAAWPFLWAYSQLALAMAVVGEGASWILQLALWLCGYLALGLITWWLLARIRPESQPSHWLRASFGWVVIESLLGLTAWTLLQQGRLPME